MYSRFILKRTFSSAPSSQKNLKPPYGGLLAAGLFGLAGAKIVKNKFEEKKVERYGCHGRPKKYVSYNPLAKIKK
jgi:hypothetical protein